jgi:hypothetical protein
VDQQLCGALIRASYNQAARFIVLDNQGFSILFSGRQATNKEKCETLAKEMT